MAGNQKALLPEARFLVPVAGGELAVFRYGPEGGKPILAIHGITSSNRAWQCFAGALVPRGYSVYAVDLRGRGDSNALPGPFGMKAHVGDMVAVLDFFSLPASDVIGHSMGGFVTVAMLSLAPGRVSRPVLIDGGVPLPLPPGLTPEQVLPLILGPALARLAMTFPSREAYRDYWRSQAAFVKGWTPVHDEYVDYDLRGEPPEMRPSTNPKAVEEDSADLFATDLIESTLRDLPREVLMLRAVRGLQNEEVPLYPEPVIITVLENYPRIRLETVADTNHYDILLDQRSAEACAEIIYGAQ
ncbi:MAG: alpha/beta hydrolase [Deltaproteobacteria bacterium]|nr:alpha/beta hydrolase [Deltaproteobacteria bacterium]